MFDFQEWSSSFLSSPVRPMSDEISNAFMNMFLYEARRIEIPAEIKEQFLYKVIESRADHIGLKVTDPAKVFLMFLTKSPGSAVMYLYALRSKGADVSVDSLAQTFPTGFLTEDSLNSMWERQKGYNCGEKGDNCLDTYSFETKGAS